jgi:transglycosylase-like protein with SLT domain
MNGEMRGGAPTVALALGVVAAAAGMLLIPLMLLAVTGIATGMWSGEQAHAYDLPRASVADIPPLYLGIYVAAAHRYRLDWSILAGIGKVECDHGRDPDPSCTHEGAVNSAGAGGPAQFLTSTWRIYGVDGNGDGVADRWNPADAIFSMANYLRASGAPSDYGAALYAYNHAHWYVVEVEHWAGVYRAAAQASMQLAPATSDSVWPGVGYVQLTPGTRAVLSPDDGHVALVPAQAPAVVQAMVIAGNELQALPYGPSGHPDPRGASSEDCSSTVNYVLFRSGVRSIAEIVRDDPLAQDYLRWGAPGRGRWVTIYATTAPTDHAFIVIAGLRLDTSHDGTDVGPNRSQGGPRWRVLDHIPRWAHWTVRHPPGL